MVVVVAWLLRVVVRMLELLLLTEMVVLLFLLLLLSQLVLLLLLLLLLLLQPCDTLRSRLSECMCRGPTTSTATAAATATAGLSIGADAIARCAVTVFTPHSTGQRLTAAVPLPPAGVTACTGRRHVHRCVLPIAVLCVGVKRASVRPLIVKDRTAP